eukprot:472241_1
MEPTQETIGIIDYFHHMRLFLSAYFSSYERNNNVIIIEAIKHIISSYSKPNILEWKPLSTDNTNIKLTNWNSTISVENNHNKNSHKLFLLSPNIINLNDMISISNEKQLKSFDLIFDFKLNNNSIVDVGFYYFQYSDLKKGLKCLNDGNDDELFDDIHCSIVLKNGSTEIDGNFADDGWSSSSETLGNNMVIGNKSPYIQSILFTFYPRKGYDMDTSKTYYMYECTAYFTERTHSNHNFKWQNKQSLFCKASRIVNNKSEYCSEMDWCGAEIVPFCSITNTAQVTILSNIDFI